MFRHSILSRFFLLTRRTHSSFACFVHDDDNSHHPLPTSSPQQQPKSFKHKEFYGDFNASGARFGALFRCRGGLVSSYSLGLGLSSRSYSSSITGEGSDKIMYISDAPDVLTENNTELMVAQNSVEVAVAQGPVMSEVAVAAADSSLPVAALQYFIDGVHTLTGLNWWAAIALTTIMIRCATVPLLINQLKATSKLTQMRPHMEEIRQQMQDSMDPNSIAEGQKQIKKLFKEYGVTPFTPLKGLLIQGPVFISFYLAIYNMVEKVPSLKGGGVFWFSDLTTPDSLYLLPVLTSLTFLLTVELNMQDGLEGNPVAGTMKKFSRILAFVAIPVTMNFPKAIFCYWVTSNLFSLMYGLVLKHPSVKKLLGIPEIVPPPTNAKGI
ncbi:hypothetical protein MRB53_035685 [Persea americana]|uniref:Uncharacterized protein n=1 Tax=Persea americana TaxID=3435 RepID=A0ACC2K5A7_PERAE|nr:hypothetical protein MRB53_035685 [Persea americana]